METKYHDTAGGVVVDESGRILVLERDVARAAGTLHEVRLPKGHVDEGETHEEAAVREVGEESGYWKVTVEADLGTAHTRFTFHGIQHERDEHYYLMRAQADARGETDFDEGSEEALFTPTWLAPGDALARMTFDTERDFVGRAIKHLAE
jgi:8-oxo-dGTP pyrophosphatase MutT (NUDIX family)